MGCLSLLQGTLPDPGIDSGSPALQEDSLASEPTGKGPTKLGNLRPHYQLQDKMDCAP